MGKSTAPTGVQKVTTYTKAQLEGKLEDSVLEKYEEITVELVATRGDKAVGVNIASKLSNDYLQKWMETLSDRLPDEMGEGSEYKSIDDWIDRNPEEPLVKALLALDMELLFAGFVPTPGVPQAGKLVLGKEGDAFREEIGTYKLDPAVGETPLVTIDTAIYKKVYGFRNVSFGVSFSLDYKGELAGKEIPVFDLTKGGFACTGKEVMYAEGEPSPNNEYTLEKTLPDADSASPYANFDIRVQAYDDLAGKVIVDELPDTLDLLGVTLSYAGRTYVLEQTETLSPGTTGYTYDKASGLMYQFPANPGGDSSKKVTQAVLSVQTMLSAEALFRLNNGDDSAGRFNNTSYLADTVNTDGTRPMDSVSGEKKFSMFAKTGVQDETDGSLLKWTIDIDVYFEGSVDFYLADALNPYKHLYDAAKGVTIETGKWKADGSGFETVYSTDTVPLEYKDISGVVGDISYENVTAETLSVIAEGEKAVYYQTGAGPSDAGAAAGAVMALNLNDYVGAGSNGSHIRITYYTKIESMEDSQEQEFLNKADLRWRALYYGKGPGPYPDPVRFQYTINKPVTANVIAANKKFAGYEEATQIASWDFDVNYYGKDYNNLIIEEEFDSIQNQIFHDCVLDGVPLTEGASGGAPYYEFDGPSNTLKVYLGNLTANQRKKLTIHTKVVGDVLAGNRTDVILANQASVSTDEGGTQTTRTTADSGQMSNTLITKWAIDLSNAEYPEICETNGYDYSKNEMKWKVTVNPNSLILENAVIKDVLPEGHELASFTLLDYKNNRINGSGGLGTGITAGGITVTPTDAGGDILFTVTGGSGGQIDGPLTIEYTTRLTEDYRKKLLQSGEASDGAGLFKKNHENTAVLTGNIVEERTPGVFTRTPVDQATASDQAVHVVEIPVLYKEGTYNRSGKGIISWDTLINAPGAAIGGQTLSDTLAASLEYRKDSLNLYRITLGESGEYADADGKPLPGVSPVACIENGSVKSAFGGTLKNTDGSKEGAAENGFSITFPQNDTSVYFLTFDTFIIQDEIAPSQIKNKMILESADGKKFSSNETDGKSDLIFRVDDYITGSRVPILILEKRSISQAAGGLHQIKLAGAEFSIWQCNLGTGLAEGDAIKVKETEGEGGRQLFVNLEAGRLYQIKESKAPDGYQLNQEDSYIYYKSAEDKALSEADFNAKFVGLPESIIQSMVVVGGNYRKLTVMDKPTDADIVFQKVNEAGTGLPQAKFLLTREDNKVEKQEFTSDGTGIFTIANLDPGIYTLKEIAAPAEYTVSAAKYTITVEALNNSVTYKAEEGGSALAPNADGRYVITNMLAEAGIKVVKQDSESDKKLSGVTYTLSGQDKLGRTPAACTAYTTGASGEIQITNLPIGTYTLKETGFPTGYLGKPVMDVEYTITVSGEGNKAKVTVAGKENEDTPEIVDFTQSRAGENAVLTLKNVPITGLVSFIKQGVDRKGSKTPAEGAVFGLFRTDIAVPAEDKAIAVEQSDATGTVKFDNIYFGEYYIKEITPPEGYLVAKDTNGTQKSIHIAMNSGNITILEKDGKNVYECTVADSSAVDNPVAQVNVMLEKINQNGGIIPGIEFAVERFGPESDVPGAGGYQPYGIGGAGQPNQVTVGADGKADLQNLIYGIYKIEETVPASVDSISQPDPFYITIGIENNQATVKRYTIDPAANPQAAGERVEVTGNLASLTVRNELKYGLMQITKVAGTRAGGTETLAKDENGNVIVIGGVRFAVYTENQVTGDGTDALPYKVKAGEEQTPFITLETDGNGGFSHSDKGEYKDAVSSRTVRFLFGTYFITEKSAPEGYLLDSRIYKVEITAHPGDSYEGNVDRLTPSYVGNCAILDDENHPYFINDMLRAYVKLDKRSDQDHNDPLTGAEFVIYTDSTSPVAVASLKDMGTGEYTLSDRIPSSMPGYNGGNGSYQQKNAQNIPYLKQENGRWTLLSGKYCLAEVKVPAGFKADRDKTPFEITSVNDLGISNTGNMAAPYFVNVYGEQDLVLTKHIQAAQAVLGNADAGDKNTNGFRFILSGTTERGTAYPETIKTTAEVAGNPGIAVFDKLPYGTYSLRESAPGDGRKASYTLMPVQTLVVNADGIRFTGGQSSFVTVTDQSAGAVTVTNTLLSGKITGMKYGQAGGVKSPLGGAVFGLYYDAAGAIGSQYLNSAGVHIQAVSGTDGKLLFENIPYGTYWIREESAPAGYDLSAQAQAGVKVVLTGSADGQSVSAGEVINVPFRAGIELTKKDSGHTPQAVSGAVFGVYEKLQGGKAGSLVAWLGESAAPGVYTLDTSGNDTMAGKVLNKAGLPCLTKDGGSFYLACGEYLVKETVTPQYFKPEEALLPLSVTNSDNAGIVRLNAVNTRRTVFMKIQEGSNYGVAGAKFAVFTDAACTLPLKDAGMNDLQVTRSQGLDGFPYGAVVLEGLSPGTYYMKEISAASPYIAGTEIFKIDIADNSSDALITVSGTGASLEEVSVDNVSYPAVANGISSDHTVNLEIILKDDGGKPIANTGFRMSRMGAYFTGARTDADGRIRFTNIPILGDAFAGEAYVIEQITTVEDYLKTDSSTQTYSMQLLKDWKASAASGATFEVLVYNEKPVNNNGGGNDTNDRNDSDKGQEDETQAEKILPYDKLPQTGGFTGVLLLLAAGIALIAGGICVILRRKNKMER